MLWKKKVFITRKTNHHIYYYIEITIFIKKSHPLFYYYMKTIIFWS